MPNETAQSTAATKDATKQPRSRSSLMRRATIALLLAAMAHLSLLSILLWRTTLSDIDHPAALQRVTLTLFVPTPPTPEPEPPRQTERRPAPTTAPPPASVRQPREPRTIDQAPLQAASSARPLASAPPSPPDFPRQGWGNPAVVADVAPRAKGPRAHPRQGFMDRVLGQGAAGPLAPTTKTLLAAVPVAVAPPKVSTKDRVDRWVRVQSKPTVGLRSGRVLAKTLRGGYRWVQASAAPSAEDDLVPTDDGGFLYQRKEWSAKIFADGRIAFDDDIASFSTGEVPSLYSRLGIPALNLTSGTFDATDALMRVAGADPYAAAKKYFLNDTEAIRDGLRSTWRASQLETAMAALRRRLDHLWTDASRSKVQRRTAIFRLFDDCSLEQEGLHARRLILTWIRRRLPASDPDAYPPHELQRFAKQQPGPAAFLPYGPLVPSRERPVRQGSVDAALLR